MEMPGGAERFQLEIGHLGLNENKSPAGYSGAVEVPWGKLQLSHTARGNPSTDRVTSGCWNAELVFRWLQERKLPWQSELELSLYINLVTGGAGLGL